MAYDFEKHQSVHEYTTTANYVLELLKYVYFDNGAMHEFDWPVYNRFMSNSNGDAIYNAYRKKVEIAQDRVNLWSSNMAIMVADFINHHKQNKTGLNIVGIRTDYNKFTSHPPSYYRRNKPEPIRTINITFKSEEARHAFAEYISQRGYYETIHSFTEAPRRGKKDLIPVG